jgi:hypothetical protein
MVAFTAASVLTASALNSAFNAYTVNAQTGTTYTFVLTDQGGLVTASNASASTYTVPANATVAYATGTRIELLNIGAGTVTLSPAGGVTLTGTTTVPQNGRVVLVKQATNTWYIHSLGGGLAFITSTTFSTAATVSINNCFTTAYENYRVVLRLTAASAAMTVDMRLRASGADTSTNYAGARLQAFTTTVNSAALTSGRIVQADTTTRAAASADIFGPQAASATVARTHGQYYDLTQSILNDNAWYQSDTTQFDGFSLLTSTGTMTGTVRVYGYSN